MEDAEGESERDEVARLPGIGVFGTGPATVIMAPLLRNAGFRIEAVWGKTVDDANECAARLGIPFATNRIDDVLLRKDVDLILVLSPPSLHAQITVKALGIGKHVAVEPPAGINQSETLRKVKAALYYPSLLSVVLYGLRFLPAFVRLKRALLEEDMIGALTLVDVQMDVSSLIGDNEAYSWACEYGMGGGVLNQFGSHVIDLLQYLGVRADRVHGTVKTLKKITRKINGIRQIQADDFATFQMEGRSLPPSMENCPGSSRLSDCPMPPQEVFVTVNICGASPTAKFSQKMTFHGSKGDSFVVSGDVLEFRSCDGVSTVLCEATPNNRNLALSHHNNARIPPIYERGLANLSHHLADKLRNCGDNPAAAADSEESVKDNGDGGGEVELADFDSALYVHAVMEAVRWSSKNKAWAKVTVAQW